MVEETVVPIKNHHQTLIHPILRLLLSKEQGCKDFYKPSKSCHVGIQWKDLAEYSQMSTHVPGFLSLYRFLQHFVLILIRHQQHNKGLFAALHTDGCSFTASTSPAYTQKRFHKHDSFQVTAIPSYLLIQFWQFFVIQ